MDGRTRIRPNTVHDFWSKKLRTKIIWSGRSRDPYCIYRFTNGLWKRPVKISDWKCNWKWIGYFRKVFKVISFISNFDWPIFRRSISDRESPTNFGRVRFWKSLQVVSRPDYFEKAVVPHLQTHGKEAMDPVDSAAKAIVKELFPGKKAIFDYGKSHKTSSRSVDTK